METREYTIDANLSALSEFVTAADLVAAHGYLAPTIVRLWLSRDGSNYTIMVSALSTTHVRLGLCLSES